MFLTATKVAPALAMGNTVVIKCSELAPATMFEFAKLVEETEIPKGCLLYTSPSPRDYAASRMPSSA